MTSHRNTDGQARLGPGELRVAVLTHLRTYPTAQLSVPDLARALGRSRGAIAKTLRVLADQGLAQQLANRPDRWTATPTRPAAGPNPAGHLPEQEKPPCCIRQPSKP
jgi:nitric oxide reductase NorQ protein